MTVLVTGAEGQLGWELRRRLGERAIGLGRSALDITDADQALRVVRAIRPAAVVNCAAYTAVDKAEQEPERCFAVNAQGVAHLAEACRQVDALLVQISTDYVFRGAGQTTPYRETDAPDPQGVYARSKLAGEQFASAWERRLILRTCGLYSTAPGARSFVETMLRLHREGKPLRVVDDQRCSPTYAADVAQAAIFLIESDARGLFHVVDSGAATWREFACEIFRQLGVSAEITPITTAELGLPAPRPIYSALDTSKYHALGGPAMPAWQQALGEFLALRQARPGLRRL